jgi:hypothetical protein
MQGEAIFSRLLKNHERFVGRGFSRDISAAEGTGL